MEISSVGSSASVTQQFAAVKQSQEGQPAARPQENAEAQARQSQSSPAFAERSAPPEGAERQEAPKPVVNAQGQKTGTIINTTA